MPAPKYQSEIDSQQTRFLKCAWCETPLKVQIIGARIHSGNQTPDWVCLNALDCWEQGRTLPKHKNNSDYVKESKAKVR